jgi:hypothetical protein
MKKKDNNKKEKKEDLIRDFKCFRKKIIYNSKEYKEIIFKKVVFGLRGFSSHPIFFDIMKKGENNFYIGDDLKLDEYLEVIIIENK